jgi:UDP-N-acetylglucosamine 2-epimerase (non-hydrolysing)
MLMTIVAGIRSGDMTMPEEINRIVTDSICDYFFTTSETANQFLRSSGVEDSRIHFVGNTMIDTLMHNINRLQKPEFWDFFGLNEKNYFLITLHRPANVDEPANLKAFMNAILDGTEDFPVLFPVHPRTRKNLELVNFIHERLIQIDPLGYLEFIYLVKNARAVITDSGGITEEATVLGVPCMTLRDSTERPETVNIGTNELVGTNPQNLALHLENIAGGKWKKGFIPKMWDGKASERIVQILLDIYQGQ